MHPHVKPSFSNISLERILERMRFRWPFTPNACGKKNRFELATYFLSRAWSLNSSTTFLNKVTVNKPCSLSSKTKLWKRTIGITEQVNLGTEKYGPTKTRVLGYRPVALRGHVTNASFKQCVGILLIPKIDRAHKNYLTPEIWEGTFLREIFYSTLIFQQSSMICISRHVGRHTLALQHGGQNYFLLKSC